MPCARSGTRASRCASIRLLRVVDGGRSVLGKPKLAARTPIVVAALRALAVGWRVRPAGARHCCRSPSAPPTPTFARRRREPRQ